MELLIAILLQLGVYATPDTLHNQDFIKQNEVRIDLANYIIAERRYEYRDGGIVIDPEVSP